MSYELIFPVWAFSGLKVIYMTTTNIISNILLNLFEKIWLDNNLEFRQD